MAIMRIAFGVEYEGTCYHGWQSQGNVASIQTQLETAFSKVADHAIAITCAGRTDKGVHAIGQVAHFETHAQRSSYAWISGTNTYLPADIRVRWVSDVTDDFHARYSATARRYLYFIYNNAVHSSIFHRNLSYYPWQLDAQRMQAGASYLLGEHNFSSYRGIDCQAKSPVRHVHYINIIRRNDLILIDIKANAFLHHMVRNITGVLLDIGTGKREPIWALEVLLAQDRKVGGITASPQGLYLFEVDYPAQFQLPKIDSSAMLNFIHLADY